MSIRSQTGNVRAFSGRRGVALIVTLAMLVLITFAILAFFVRATANRGIESGSTSRAEAEILARSAQNAIVAELQHEMLAGSDTTGSDTSSAPPRHYVLRPKTPQDAVPQRILTAAVAAATPATDNKFNNLVKQSASGSFAFTGTSPAPTIKAVAARTDTASLDGRVVGLNRWNLPQLIGDSTGASGFDNVTELPEWVVVTRGGINSSLTIAQAKNRTLANANYVIGRFAYNIYDEGGLVDINSAGYPSSSGTGDNLQILKGARAGIDLSQIPGIDTAANAESLVNWRNAASKTGFTPVNPNALDWYVNLAAQAGLLKGFLKPWTPSSGGTSDQRFLSRQDLILYATSGQAGISSKALPFLTTFSRDLDQPSHAPDPGRPRALSNTAADNYAGNDASGHDDDFNPAFLSVRVTRAFARNDTSQAVVGEPLVKKRLALNRLAWLTYQGPSASRSLSDPDIKTLLNNGITASFLQQGNDENIQKYFGLVWDKIKHYWTYDHGIKGSTGKPIIGYLAKVRDANREPDFFELLKTAISAGSIAKGATNPARQGHSNGLLEESNDFTYDTKLDYAILQIGANIIDQFDADGYPTRIRFTDGIRVEEFHGTENLPFFYRVRSNTVISALPNPASGNTVTAGIDKWTSPSDLTDSGFYAVFWLPEIWNPHDINSSLGSPRPTKMRIVVDGSPLDADGNSLTGAYNSNRTRTRDWARATGLPIASKVYYTDDDPMLANAFMDAAKTPPSYTTTDPTATVTWQGDNTALTFTDNNGALFREPTLLMEPNVPTGSNLALGPDNLMRTLYQDPRLQRYWADTGIKCLNDPDNLGTAVPYIGFYFGQGPVRWVMTTTTGIIGSYVMTTTENEALTSTNSGSSANTFRVQYSDNGTDWTTYDQKYVPNIRQFQTLGTFDTGGKLKTSNDATGTFQWVASTDPRTRRFGNPGAGNRGSLLLGNRLTWLDKTNRVLASDRPDTSSGFGWWSSYKSPRNKGVLDSVCMAEVGGWYPNPETTWMPDSPAPPMPLMHYRPGLLSQNNPAAISNNFAPQGIVDSALSAQYYSDPDGVVRRAMGAFVPTNGSTAPAATTIGLPMAKTFGVGSVANQSQSRPIVLNRPFRSVAELGYVFSGTPWKNLDLFTPESGYSALLDTFCIQETDRADALVAGKVNLNTRQKPVLQAILSGTGKDALTVGASITQAEATSLATLLPARTQSASTTGGPGPLRGIGDLVGRWYQSTTASQGGIDGSQSYDGFSADVGTVFSANPTWNNIERFREAPIRALADVGTARTWNLLIDLIVQSGRYPDRAATFSDFLVQGEQHYWVHLAIDRNTGQVIDQQLEAVRE